VTYKVVIETSTGHALRAGFCDFETDGSFDSEKETIIDAPFPIRVKPRRRLADGEAEEEFIFDMYDGDAWVTASIMT